MPTYQYRCADCGGELEAVQKFTDPSLTECPTCRGTLRKVFNAVGVVFKGSGFYATDNRAQRPSTSASSESSTGENKTKESAPKSDTASSGSGSKASSPVA